MDLNSLCLTCKTFRDTCLPKLYRCVAVRIPAGDFQLDALEDLLSGSVEGLKFTRELRVLPQQGPLHDVQHRNRHRGGLVGRYSDYHPGSRVTSLFNILMRQLIKKIPNRSLQRLEYVFSDSLLLSQPSWMK